MQSHRAEEVADAPCVELQVDGVNDEVAQERVEQERHVNVAAFSGWLSQMQVTRPEMLRAVPAWVVLWRLGRELRRRHRSVPEHGRLHGESLAVTSISEFWSHSWHGRAGTKVLTLLFYQNSWPALLAGTFIAMLMSIMFALGFFPGWMKTSSYGPKEPHAHGVWCVVSAMLTYWLVILFRRPSGNVFVDVFCINQADKKLKAEGILNIGATLKHSQTLLVLWDETYLRRLWCIFELAAFLKSHEDAKIVFKPTALGPATLLCSLTIGGQLVGDLIWPYASGLPTLVMRFLASALVAILLTWPVWEFWKGIMVLHDQLENFSVASTRCSCCDTGHLNGELCDREVILATIMEWFGSLEAFEESVRGDVSAKLQKELRMSPFGYTWLLHAGNSILWVQVFDKPAALLLEGEMTWAACVALGGLTWYLLAYPAQFAFMEWWVKHLHQRELKGCGRLCLTLCWSTVAVAMLLYYFVLMEYLPSPLLGAACFLSSSVLVFGLIWRVKSR